MEIRVTHLYKFVEKKYTETTIFGKSLVLSVARVS